MSEKSTCRRARRTLAAARPPRADDHGFASASPLLLNVYATISTRPLRIDQVAGTATPPTSAAEVWAIERLGIQEDGHGIIEGDAVLRRVGLSLPRVPLEH